MIKPELPRYSVADERIHAYPEFLRQWWRKGRVEALRIDTHGSLTRCQVWQLTRNLGSYRCHERYYQAETWALEAERLKAELLIESVREQIDILRNELANASAVSKLDTNKSSCSEV